MKETTYTLEIGSISHATLKPIDIALAIHRELDYANAYENANVEIPEPYEGFDGFDCDDEFWDTESANWYLEELFELMDSLCPSYCYFGNTEGDGSDFGVWPDIEGAKENVGRVVSCDGFRTFVDGEQVGSDDDIFADGFQGEWLHINDHGNVTLYARVGDENQEIWAVV